MQLVHNRCLFSDKQVLRLQETPGNLMTFIFLILDELDETPDGQTPYTVSMFVYDYLVDVGKPGDRYHSFKIRKTNIC